MAYDQKPGASASEKTASAKHTVKTATKASAKGMDHARGQALTEPGDPAQAKVKAARLAQILRDRTGLYKLAAAVEATDYGKPESVTKLLETLYAEPWIGRPQPLNDALARLQILIRGFSDTGKLDPELEQAFVLAAYALPLADGERDVSEDGLTAREKDKRAKVLADYQASFGDEIGQLFFTAMDDATSAQAIAGYAKQGSDAVFDLASGLLAKVDDMQSEEAAKVMTDKLAAEYKARIGKQVEELVASPAGQRLLEKFGVTGFLDAVKSNPEMLLKAVLVGGYIAYGQNPKLPKESKVGLGHGQSLSLVHDLGKIQNLALKEVSATFSKSVPSTKAGAKEGDTTKVVEVGAGYEQKEGKDGGGKTDVFSASALLSSPDGLNGISGGIVLEGGEVSTYHFKFNLADDFKKASGGIQRDAAGVTTANLFTQIGSKTHFGSAGVSYDFNRGELKLGSKQKFGNLTLSQEYLADHRQDDDKGGTGTTFDAHQVFAGFDFDFGPGHKAGGPKDGMKYSVGGGARYEIQDQELIDLSARFAMSKPDWTSFVASYRYTHAANVSQHVFEASLKQQIGKVTAYASGNASIVDGAFGKGGGEIGAMYKVNKDLQFGGIFGVEGTQGQAAQIKIGASIDWKGVPLTIMWRPLADKLLPNAENPGLISLGFKKAF